MWPVSVVLITAVVMILVELKRGEMLAGKDVNQYPDP